MLLWVSVPRLSEWWVQCESAIVWLQVEAHLSSTAAEERSGQLTRPIYSRVISSGGSTRPATAPGRDLVVACHHSAPASWEGNELQTVLVFGAYESVSQLKDAPPWATDPVLYFLGDFDGNTMDTSAGHQQCASCACSHDARSDGALYVIALSASSCRGACAGKALPSASCVATLACCHLGCSGSQRVLTDRSCSFGWLPFCNEASTKRKQSPACLLCACH
jgi:hypothetical protein